VSFGRAFTDAARVGLTRQAVRGRGRRLPAGIGKGYRIDSPAKGSSMSPSERMSERLRERADHVRSTPAEDKLIVIPRERA
jgi:hypothetical protein